MQQLPAEGELLILGAGVSGRGAARLLMQRGYRCRFFDEHAGGDCLTDPAVIGSGDFRGVVESPGFGPAHPAVAATLAAGLPLFSEVEVAIALSEVPYIGVTGSNGKTTTTALLAHLLQAQGGQVPAVGNIGYGFCDAVQADAEADRYVVEFSSYQLERFAPARPAEVALLLNISPDHLERHGTLENYIDAKLNLAHKAEALVYNADDAAFTRLPQLLPELPAISFGVSNPHADIMLERGMIRIGERLLPTEYQLQGEHNLQNVMAALGACMLLGFEPEQVNRAAASFAPLPHRLEPVATLAGVDYINDSKATNEDAVNYALRSFAPGSVHLLAGGMIKSDDLSALRPLIDQQVVHLYLYGRDRERISTGLGNPADLSLFETLEEALQAAAGAAAPGETVLLSPMGASFDQYRNFEERGNSFRELVRKLAGESAGTDSQEGPHV